MTRKKKAIELILDQCRELEHIHRTHIVDGHYERCFISRPMAGLPDGVEIVIDGEEDDELSANTPHFHIRVGARNYGKLSDSKSQRMELEVYIKDIHKLNVWRREVTVFVGFQVLSRVRRKVRKWLDMKNPSFEGYTNWQVLVHFWNVNNPSHRIQQEYAESKGRPNEISTNGSHGDSFLLVVENENDYRKVYDYWRSEYNPTDYFDDENIFQPLPDSQSFWWYANSVGLHDEEDDYCYAGKAYETIQTLVKTFPDVMFRRIKITHNKETDRMLCHAVRHGGSLDEELCLSDLVVRHSDYGDIWKNCKSFYAEQKEF